MKILVISDSHGRRDLVAQCIMQNELAQTVIHLGDMASDIEELRSVFPDRQIINVKGNCDVYSDLPAVRTFELEGVRFHISHGHTLAVNYGLTTMMAAARREGANICLYGHTHVPYNKYHDGLYVMNPGSIAYPRDSSRQSYGLIEICPQGIMTNIVPLKKLP